MIITKFVDCPDLSADEVQALGSNTWRQLQAGCNIPCRWTVPDGLEQPIGMSLMAKNVFGHVVGIEPGETSRSFKASIDVPNERDARRLKTCGALTADVEQDWTDEHGKEWGVTLCALEATEPLVQLSNPVRPYNLKPVSPDPGLDEVKEAIANEYISDNVDSQLEAIDSDNGLASQLQADGVDLKKLLPACKIVGQTWARGELTPVIQPQGSASGVEPVALDKFCLSCGLKSYVRPVSRLDRGQPLLGRPDVVHVRHRDNGKPPRREFFKLKKPTVAVGSPNSMVL